MDERLALNDVKLFLNSLNSMEGAYRRKGNNEVEHYFRRSQEIIWALLDEVELYRISDKIRFIGVDLAREDSND